SPEPFKRLERQSVDEIEIDGTHAVAACGIDDVERVFHTLHAVHGLLDARIEVLHTEADAIETERGELFHASGIDSTWIDFNGELVRAVGAEVEALMQPVHQRRHLPGGQEGRCAATEMKLLHNTAVEQARLQVDLAVQPFEVETRLERIASDDARARAVETRTGAEGNMRVDGQRLRAVVAVLRLKPVVGFAEGFRELDGRRIRSVTRPDDVVAGQQSLVELHRLDHD